MNMELARWPSLRSHVSWSMGSLSEDESEEELLVAGQASSTPPPLSLEEEEDVFEHVAEPSTSELLALLDVWEHVSSACLLSPPPSLEEDVWEQVTLPSVFRPIPLESLEVMEHVEYASSSLPYFVSPPLTLLVYAEDEQSESAYLSSFRSRQVAHPVGPLGPCPYGHSAPLDEDDEVVTSSFSHRHTMHAPLIIAPWPLEHMPVPKLAELPPLLLFVMGRHPYSIIISPEKGSIFFL